MILLFLDFLLFYIHFYDITFPYLIKDSSKEIVNIINNKQLFNFF